MSSLWGRFFRVMTFGESHGVALGCVIDGCPSGLTLSLEHIQDRLNRRRPGQSPLTTPRNEPDQVEILSGINEQNITLGSPIALLIRNTDVRPKDYAPWQGLYRPGHADYTTFAKYGVTSSSGGGRASARETVARVAAAAVAEQWVRQKYPTLDVLAWTCRVAHLEATVDFATITAAAIESSPLRCPDVEASHQAEELILQTAQEGDSLGGAIEVLVQNVPTGLGAPVFDKLEAEFAKAMMSLPASKFFEMGSGVVGTYEKGSSQNDAFFTDPDTGTICTRTNHSGGIQGGISNGMPLHFKVGFKPVSSIRKPQETVNHQGETATLNLAQNPGRHDPCVLPRAVPLVEAMVWLVLADAILSQRCYNDGVGLV